MSEVKVNKVSPRSGTGLQLGDSGDTITIPAGATLANSGTATGTFPAPTSGIAASAIDSGTIATARLGSGTASSSTFLRGDQTYAEAGGGYTQSSVLTPLGSYIEFDNIPAGTNSIVIKSYAIQWAGSPGNLSMQIGDSGGYETSGYNSVDFYRGVSDVDMGATALTSGSILAYVYSGTHHWKCSLLLNDVGGNSWV